MGHDLLVGDVDPALNTGHKQRARTIHEPLQQLIVETLEMCVSAIVEHDTLNLLSPLVVCAAEESLDRFATVGHQNDFDEPGAITTGDSLELSDFRSCTNVLRHDYVSSANEMCSEHRLSDRPDNRAHAHEVCTPATNEVPYPVDVQVQGSRVFVDIARRDGGFPDSRGAVEQNQSRHAVNVSLRVTLDVSE